MTVVGLIKKDRREMINADHENTAVSCEYVIIKDLFLNVVKSGEIWTALIPANSSNSVVRLHSLQPRVV